MFSFNQTTRSKMSPGRTGLSQSVNFVSNHKREKIKDLLMIKFMKKYGISEADFNIESELGNFLKKESITEQDLKLLDSKLGTMVSERRSCNNLLNGLTNKSLEGLTPSNQVVKHPRLNSLDSHEIMNDNRSVASKQSRMSGISKLSFFSNLNETQKALKNQTYKDMVQSSSYDKPLFSIKPPFAIKGDNWGEINKYNQTLFEQEKKDNKLKEFELKKRTRETLDTQIREKNVRKSQELMRERQFDDIIIQHVENMNNLEKQKEVALKLKMLKEKDCRDKQLEDEMIRKKIEAYKQKKYERELVRTIKEEIEKEKQHVIDKKVEEKAALMKLLEENELRKITLQEMKHKQRQVDIQANLDMQRVVDLREKERLEYFKNRERKSSETNNKAIETVVKALKQRTLDEEFAMKRFEEEKEKRLDDLEKEKQQKAIETRREIKAFLDKQVEDKKKVKEFEKIIDDEQGKAWITDSKNYTIQVKETNEKIRSMNKENLDYLRLQLNERKSNDFGVN